MPKMPHARRSGLIVKEADGEVLIYDLERNKAHCLNNTAAKVWQYCDGETTVAAACNALSRELNATCDEKLVWYALEQFTKDNLLEASVPPPAFMVAGMTRRQMVRTLGLTALIAVPLVTTIMAPTPAQAGTCKPSTSACTASVECCSNICTANVCA